MKVKHIPFKTPYINVKLSIIARMFMQKNNKAIFSYEDYEGNISLLLSIPTILYIHYYIKDGKEVYLVKNANQEGFKEMDGLEAMQYAEDCLKELYEEGEEECN